MKYKFAIGTKIKLITPVHGTGNNNPVWGGRQGNVCGLIIKHKPSGLPYQVEWENGSHNAYNEGDLEAIRDKHLPDDLFEI